MKFFRIMAYAVGIVISLVLLFFIAAWIFEYRPAAKETIHVAQAPGTLGDTIRVLTWNTGYGGLGDNMDFFYDGGAKVRDAKERTSENVKSISDFLSFIDADIIFLQEVDISSYRTYGINQLDIYKAALSGYHAYFAYNYNSFFVPVPLKEPIGKVQSGMAIFSKVEPARVTRYSYPGGFRFPVRLFNLKRCLLSAEFIISGGRTILLNNTHNSAFDDGGMRKEETAFLRDMLSSWYRSGALSITGGDWNQTPPGYVLSPQEYTKNFTPLNIAKDTFDPQWEFVYDESVHTVRYLYESYKEGRTPTSVIDMFLISPGIECTGIRTVDLGFRNSDHNPVAATFVVR